VLADRANHRARESCKYQEGETAVRYRAAKHTVFEPLLGIVQMGLDLCSAHRK